MIGYRGSSYLRQAAEWGMALGLIMALAIMVIPTGRDDFSRVLWPAGRAGDPYASGLYFYPVWNTWVLRLLALFSREIALILVWSSSLVIMVGFAPIWGTPPWLALLAPPFLTAMLFGHPFEAMVFAGVSFIAVGWRVERAWMVGLGVGLCLFKLQIGLLPALVGVWSAAGIPGSHRRWLWIVPVGMVVLASLLEWVCYGRVWLGPWLDAIRRAPELARNWNASMVQGFHFFSGLWLPIGLWLGSKVEEFRRRLWIAMAVGLLISPYWAGYSLYPLIAMAGCWRARGDEVGGHLCGIFTTSRLMRLIPR